MSLMLCLGFEAVFAQTRNISGTVIGIDDGLPIPGVSIVVKGVENGYRDDPHEYVHPT